MARNRFYLRILSDVDYNSVYEANLPPAPQYLSNVYSRENEKQVFFRKMDSAFAMVKSSPSGRNYHRFTYLLQRNSSVFLKALPNEGYSLCIQT